MVKAIKKLNYRHVICGVITAAFLLWGVFMLRYPYFRALDGIKDLGFSIAFYFLYFMGLGEFVAPTVTQVPGSLEGLPSLLPDTFEVFQDKFGDFGSVLISGENFSNYFSGFGSVINNICVWLMFLLPFVVLFIVLYRRALQKENNDYNVDSKQLKFVKKAAAKVYIPAKQWFKGFIEFLKENSLWVKIWVFIALLNFNAMTIILEALAYYFYFAASFDILVLYMQAYKLVIDLWVMFAAVPVFMWVIAGYVFFLWWRSRIAYKRLYSFESRNRGFINNLPVVSMICGTMGKKKTTMLTDMALSQEVMHRDKAFEKILENDLKFPYFPWCNLENEIKRGIEFHEIYNLATCRVFIKKKRNRFDRQLAAGAVYAVCRKWCFDYDFMRYGMQYDNKLYVEGLFDVLEIYAQAFFIYLGHSSLLVANYSIREDNVIEDVGNFPLWNSDFFKRDSRLIGAMSRHAKILDFDMLRLGRKLVEDNYKADVFEFGVIAFTESGKERGNMLDNQGKKKNADETNQKNDLFNMWLKTARHSATVDNYPFIKVFMDEQRPESMGADVRELCDIVHIRDTSEIQLALPFFYVENLLYGFFFSWFKKMYYDYRFSRADNTLFLYAVKKIFSIIYSAYTRAYNKFGFCVLAIETERGTMDSPFVERKYYLCSKKVYAKRFVTDSYGDYFMSKALRSPIGLVDLPEYETERATFDEFKSQNSYFINELKGRLEK